jgi:hypothetical protein
MQVFLLCLTNRQLDTKASVRQAQVHQECFLSPDKFLIPNPQYLFSRLLKGKLWT